MCVCVCVTHMCVCSVDVCVCVCVCVWGGVCLDETASYSSFMHVAKRN